MRRLILCIALALPAPSAAHTGHDHGIGWTFAPAVTVPLGVWLLLYALGLMRLVARSRRGRCGMRRSAALFLAGWALLALSLTSPLHEGGERSFTLHMIEHELIMLPAALLLVSARPGPMLLWGLPRSLRRAIGGAAGWRGWSALGSAPVATAIQAVVLVGWHLPGLFDRALRHEAWHVAQHLSFVGAALLFWWAMLRHPGGSARLVAAACLFATSLVGGALGALMALAASPWYAAYARMGTTALGLAPEQDQQLAGLIMWVPGGLFHLGAALVLLVCAFGGSRPAAALAGAR